MKNSVLLYVFFMAVCIVCAVCVAGCEKERTEQVIWKNDTSYDLSVKIYTDNGEWDFDLMQGSEKIIYNQKYTVPDPNIDSFNPSHYPPFEDNWKCDHGIIDSVIFTNIETQKKMTTCSNGGISYKPLAQSNCYEMTYGAKQTRYTFCITDKRYKMLMGECPCNDDDAIIVVDSMEGTIHFDDFYAVWYFKSRDVPQMSYMLEYVPNEYCQENLSVILSGRGQVVQLIEPHYNFFTGGCLSSYIIEK